MQKTKTQNISKSEAANLKKKNTKKQNKTKQKTNN